MDGERLRLEDAVVRAEQRVSLARAMAERYPTVLLAQQRLRRAENEMKRARNDLDRLKLKPPN